MSQADLETTLLRVLQQLAENQDQEPDVQRDEQVREFLDIDQAQLRALLSETQEAGITAPCARTSMNGHRRWFGGRTALRRWMGELEEWRVSTGAEKAGKCDGARSPAEIDGEPARPSGRHRSSRERSNTKRTSAETGRPSQKLRLLPR